MPTPTPTPTRQPLRLTLRPRDRHQVLDGGWWPQSRDLETELADLVDHAPASLGRISRALYSPPDWDSAPHRIRIGRGPMKTGGFPHDDTHLMILTMYDRSDLRLLVVPPSFSEDQGSEALLAAGAPNNPETAADILTAVTEFPEVDRSQLWKPVDSHRN